MSERRSKSEGKASSRGVERFSSLVAHVTTSVYFPPPRPIGSSAALLLRRPFHHLLAARLVPELDGSALAHVGALVEQRMDEPAWKKLQLSLERPYKDDNGQPIPTLFDITPEGQHIYEP